MRRGVLLGLLSFEIGIRTCLAIHQLIHDELEVLPQRLPVFLLFPHIWPLESWNDVPSVLPEDVL